MTFLLPSSSWLLKLPIVVCKRPQGLTTTSFLNHELVLYSVQAYIRSSLFPLCGEMHGERWTGRIGTAKCEEHFVKRALAHYFVHLPFPFKHLHRILPLQGEESPSGTDTSHRSSRLRRFCLLLPKSRRAIRSRCFRRLSR